MPLTTIYFVVVVTSLGTIVSTHASNGSCNCVVPCDKKTGLCPSNCARGWKNGRFIQKHNMRECTTPCRDGTFSWFCEKTCHCRNNSFCDKRTGSCSGPAGGCASGWINSAGQDNCQREKCRGKFGPSCTRDCHCKHNAACNSTTGSCSRAGGCAHGWMSVGGLETCQRHCPKGTYGYKCLGTCACVTERACRLSDGACTDGKCANGYPYQYKQLDGTRLCLKKKLPQCHCHLICDHITGLCSGGGCAPGWHGDYNYTVHQRDCKYPCSNRTFGRNCLKFCHCKNNELCNHETGSCAEAGGCHQDWKSGPKDNSCQIPKCHHAFGPCCENDCHCRQNDKCNKVNGSCERAGGCDNGWISAPGRDDCQLKCPSGTYGLNCTEKSPCATVAATRHTDGACMDDKGCAPEYEDSYIDPDGFTVCLRFSLSDLLG